MTRLLGEYDVPEVIHTDQLQSYGAAIRKLLSLTDVDHQHVISTAHCNNIIEQRAGPTRVSVHDDTPVWGYSSRSAQHRNIDLHGDKSAAGRHPHGRPFCPRSQQGFRRRKRAQEFLGHCQQWHFGKVAVITCIKGQQGVAEGAGVRADQKVGQHAPGQPFPTHLTAGAVGGVGLACPLPGTQRHLRIGADAVSPQAAPLNRDKSRTVRRTPPRRSPIFPERPAYQARQPASARWVRRSTARAAHCCRAQCSSLIHRKVGEYRDTRVHWSRVQSCPICRVVPELVDDALGVLPC
ncbi:hypothetical protein EHF33_19670 (plasmid) [Deinococcus psychrotolerans]|uniref:DDE domain-containing protein n=1 Tax=Deinococcus psychrotolerans TaxID=2489213 RepID=A0A3G8YLJ4_9DEIO|nr:hypothetical protein EHF33_19670 [Deinococcus psychrotolerans]